MTSSIRALAALFAAAAVMTGCGGGGGGSTTVPAPAPVPPAAATSATPLAITVATAGGFAELAPGIGEGILTVAQFAVDSTRRFAVRGTPSPSTSTCPNGGLLTVTLIDRDGDGVASPGDRISVEARDCAVPILTDIVTGAMQIDISAPTGLPAASLRATVSLAEGLRFGATSTNATNLLGSMQFDWSSTGLQTSLHVTTSSADDLRVVFSGTTLGGAALTEAIRQPDLTKTLEYDEARAVVSMSYRYESDALQGSVVVTTPVALRSYLNTYPEAGRMEVTGAAGSKVVITPNFVSNSSQFQYELDSNGDGTADANGSGLWANSTLGYLWWDGATALSGWSTGAYSTRSFATTDFFASATFDWTTSSTSSLRLQFSRPLASTTPTLFARFIDQGSTINDGTQRADIPAFAQVRGALVTVRPTVPLRHARYYTFQVSLDGTNWSSGVTVQDAFGNSSSNNQWSGISFSTPNNLRALAVSQGGMLGGASDQISLDAQTSTGSPREIVSYQWSQVAGTPLRFTDAAAAQTTVSWGTAPPTGIERAVVRLTVADAAGDTESADLTILSGNLSASNHLLYFNSAVGDYIGGGTTVLLDTSLAQFQDTSSAGYFRASVSTPGYSEWWSLDLGNADGSALRVGAYENAIRAAFRGNQNGIDFSGSGRGCNQTVGRFDILEIQTDDAGAITRLAVDFEQHCEFAGAPALLGSYRLNSSVPIRR
ncbi:hypothetical protein BH11PSE8_BH11PSE8_16990 [soil metagenome]